MYYIVVTGATSFLGKGVISKLLESGFKVYSVVRADSMNLNNIVEHQNNTIVYEDLDTIARITSTIKRADVFIHFGWSGEGSVGRSNKDIQKINVKNSMQALKTAEKLRCQKFIFAGSQAEYGIQNEKILETAVCEPVSEYGKAKLEFGEAAAGFCENNAMQFIHLRIFSVYGPGDHEAALVPSCIRNFSAGLDMEFGECSQLWNYLHISDFAEIIARLIQTNFIDKTCILNVASEDTRPLREFVEAIYDSVASESRCSYGVRPQNAEGAAQLYPSIERIEQLINWKPQVRFEDGIKDML